MGKLGEEVSQKIKCAIRAKLVELGINMENELPDYVMVLVANKKSQKQMDEDLQLFLGPSTNVFTTWLHSVLKRLEQVTVSPKGFKKKTEETKDKSKKSTMVENDGEKKEGKKQKSYLKDDILKGEISLDEQSDSRAENDSDVRVKKEPVEPMTDEEGGDNDCLNIDVEMDTDVMSDERENELLGKESGRSILRAKYKSKPNEDSNGESRSEINKKHSVQKSDINKEAELIKTAPVREKIHWGKGKDTMEKKISHAPKEESSGRKIAIHEDVDHSTKKVNERLGENEKHRKVKEPIEVRDKDDKVIRIRDAREILKQKANNTKRSTSKPSSSEQESLEEEGSPDWKKKHLSSVSKVVREVREGEKPVDVTIPSLVKVTPRPLRRTGIQANCNLILKAVADAEKSVATANTTRKAKEPKRRTRVTREEFAEYIPPAKISITLPNDRVPSTKEEERENQNDGNTVNPEQKEEQMDVDPGDLLSAPEQESSQQIDSEPYYLEPTQELFGGEEEVQWRETVEPKFLVTLGREPPNNLYYEDDWESDERLSLGMSKAEVDEFFEQRRTSKTSHERIVYSNVQMNRDRLGPAPIVAVRPLQKLTDSAVEAKKEKALLENAEPKKIVHIKVLKRCKYWPNCLVGDACEFHHPEILCRLFPNCKFGDQCIYVHPVCKFGDHCHNVTCKYMHIWKPNSSAKSGSSASFKGSTSFAAPYNNPRNVPLCRFGSKCLRYDCQFNHGPQPLPSKDQLKWKKPPIL